MHYRNISTLVQDRISQHSERNIFYVREHGDWVGLSWEQFGQQVHAFGSALVARGLNRGTCVCILMGTVPQWPVADVGTIMAGGVSVGLYPTSSPQQCQYIIQHSDAEFVLVDTLGQLDKILHVVGDCPKVKDVIVLDEEAAGGRPGISSYREFLEFGQGQLARTQPVLRERAESADPEDITIMVYTSGTTGLPKGACLSHRYVLNSVESLLQTIPISPSDVSFSYLPYCHVAERIAGLYNRIYAGAPAYFVDDLNKLWQYMLEVKPTVFGSLPRFYEKIHARILSDLDQASPGDRDQFAAAHEFGRRLSQRRQAGKPIPDSLMRQFEETAAPILSKVRDYFGGRIRITTSGGAPLSAEVAEFFDAAGIPILQAYGLTENICVAFNRPDWNKFGTVGPPMPGCEVKLGDDGELMVRSNMMFSGYYKAPEETVRTFQNGWLLTGDLADIDRDGFLKIRGRKKEIIVTSTGKNIAPMLIENAVKEHPLISQTMVYGDGKSYLVALVTLNQVEAEAYTRARGLDFDDFKALTEHDEIRSVIQKHVDIVNARFSSTEAIRKFVILERDLTIDNDEITPTLKVKRATVTEKFRGRLEGLYV